GRWDAQGPVRVAGLGMQNLNGSVECIAEPQARPAPSPRGGEGWGEGVTIERLVPPHPLPSRSRMLPTSAMSLSGRTRVNPSSVGERESRRARRETVDLPSPVARAFTHVFEELWEGAGRVRGNCIALQQSESCPCC